MNEYAQIVDSPYDIIIPRGDPHPSITAVGGNAVEVVNFVSRNRKSIAIGASAAVVGAGGAKVLHRYIRSRQP
ncbi:MAG: hypothetical protein HZC02_01610 [Candidatus Levybacteria bacterium]|nr:hypothetical protein [Candidatus Levybacteria bacterium]